MAPTLHQPSASDSAQARSLPTRVLILERDATTLARLMAAVESDPSLTLVTVTRETASLVKLVAQVRPEVALVNSRPEEGGGAGLIQRLRSACPDTRCIALSSGEDRAELAEMFAAGAVGCVDTTATNRTLTHTIHEIGTSQRDINGSLAASLSDGTADLAPAEPDPGGRDYAAAAKVSETIKQRQFEMVFQPIVDLEGGDVIGMEALARFVTTPPRSPAAWLRDAEAVGLRRELELELLCEALGQGRRLPPGAFMTVNLSPQTAMSDGLAHALPPAQLGRLVLEITDHLGVEDYQSLAEALAGLRAGGLRIAVDDSGQGLSSLRGVSQLAPDFIKLNRELTRDIDRDATRRTLALALASIARQIGAAVIAEGIETSAELHALRSLGVAYGQGYLIARPEPLPEASPAVVELPSEQPGEREAHVVLPQRSLASLREASRAAFELLERELPGSRCFVSQLDYQRRRFLTVACSASFAAHFEPGFSTRLEQSLCFHMASGKGPRLSGDAAVDPVYGNLPLQQELEITSYAGVPLELSSGKRLGSLALVSRAPHGYDEDALSTLNGVAGILVRVLEREAADAGAGSPGQHLRTLATTDWLTGVLNRPSFVDRLQVEVGRRGRRRPTAHLLHLAPDGFDAMGDRYGRAVAQLVIKDIADSLIAVSEGGDAIGRLDETEFAVLLRKRTTPEAARYYSAQISKRLQDTLAKRDIPLTIQAGLVPLTDDSADAAMASARAAAEPLF